MFVTRGSRDCTGVKCARKVRFPSPASLPKEREMRALSPVPPVFLRFGESGSLVPHACRGRKCCVDKCLCRRHQQASRRDFHHCDVGRGERGRGKVAKVQRDKGNCESPVAGCSTNPCFLDFGTSLPEAGSGDNSVSDCLCTS